MLNMCLYYLNENGLSEDELGEITFDTANYIVETYNINATSFLQFDAANYRRVAQTFIEEAKHCETLYILDNSPFTDEFVKVCKVNNFNVKVLPIEKDRNDSILKNARLNGYVS